MNAAFMTFLAIVQLVVNVLVLIFLIMWLFYVPLWIKRIMKAAESLVPPATMTAADAAKIKAMIKAHLEAEADDEFEKRAGRMKAP